MRRWPSPETKRDIPTLYLNLKINSHYLYRQYICFDAKHIYMDREEQNYAFIDAQNLHLGTTLSKHAWRVDLYRFHQYLERKYAVSRSFYFLGAMHESHASLYARIQDAGFIIHFRQHNQNMLGKKKGNVDPDIIFDVMKRLYKREVFDKVVLISGDGDYKLLVDFLVEEGRLKKVLFPNKEFASSLYKTIEVGLKTNLSEPDVRRKIEYKGER